MVLVSWFSTILFGQAVVEPELIPAPSSPIPGPELELALEPEPVLEPILEPFPEASEPISDSITDEPISTHDDPQPDAEPAREREGEPKPALEPSIHAPVPGSEQQHVIMMSDVCEDLDVELLLRFASSLPSPDLYHHLYAKPSLLLSKKKKAASRVPFHVLEDGDVLVPWYDVKFVSSKLRMSSRGHVYYHKDYYAAKNIYPGFVMHSWICRCSKKRLINVGGGKCKAMVFSFRALLPSGEEDSVWTCFDAADVAHFIFRTPHDLLNCPAMATDPAIVIAKANRTWAVHFIHDYMVGHRCYFTVAYTQMARVFTMNCKLPLLEQKEHLKMVYKPEPKSLRTRVSVLNRLLTPAIPTSMKAILELQMPWHYTHLSTNELFLMFSGECDVGGGGMMIFCTDAFLKDLCNAEVIFGDGTFTAAPKPFEQMYVIHYLKKDNNTAVAAAYVLLTNKSTESYDFMLNKLIARASQIDIAKESIKWKTVVLDFECAAIASFKKAFADEDGVCTRLRVQGCLFHFHQAIQKNAAIYGFDERDEAKPYRKSTYTFLKSVKCLPFLHPGSIEVEFERLCEELIVAISGLTEEAIAQYNDEVHQKKFFHYLRTTWILDTAKLKRDVWSVWFAQHNHRTNNLAEGFNRLIQLLFNNGTGQKQSLWGWIHDAMEMHERIEGKLLGMDLGGCAGTEHTKKYLAKCSKLEGFRINLSNGTSDCKAFLDNVIKLGFVPSGHAKVKKTAAQVAVELMEDFGNDQGIAFDWDAVETRIADEDVVVVVAEETKEETEDEEDALFRYVLELFGN